MRPGDVITPTRAFSFRTGSSLQHHRVWWDRGEPALVLACDSTSSAIQRRKALLVMDDGMPRWTWLSASEVCVRKAGAV